MNIPDRSSLSHFFEYDSFQIKAIESIRANESCFVSAPTGSGKTAIAEYAIDVCLKRGSRLVYTAPVKALSNQKYRDFCEKYGCSRVGLITGDVVLNRSASIVIMTTEVFRNTLFDQNTLQNIDGVDWIVYDEIHYLDDFDRGTVWEESLMFMPDQMRFLALSATIPNVGELVRWLKSHRKQKIRQIVHSKRVVPLEHFFCVGDQVFSDLKKLRKYMYLHRREKHLPSYFEDKITLLRYLKKNKKVPCLFFAFGRRKCEKLAEISKKIKFLNSSEQSEILHEYDALLNNFSIEKEDVSANKMRELIQYGIAYHHAGLSPALKEVIERLYLKKRLSLIVTTETFAIGLNMPVKTVIFDELRKFYGFDFSTLKTRDYYQMAGRAGRRGIDKKGSVYSFIDFRYIKIGDLNRIVHTSPEPVKSRFNAGYATLLNLYTYFGFKMEKVYKKSFHYSQSSFAKRKKTQDLICRRLALLESLHYLEGEKQLSSKGVFASQLFGYELILGELYEDGFLQNLTEKHLVIMLGALLYEPRKGVFAPKIKKEYLFMKKKSREIVRYINKAQKLFGIYTPIQDPSFHLSSLLECWSEGIHYCQLQSDMHVDEGEFIRYTRMIIQVLQQMLSFSQLTKNFRETVFSSIRLINRDVMDAEKQLREGLEIEDVE